MGGLGTPFPDLPAGPEQPVHGRDRAQVDALIQQDGVDLRRRQIDEPPECNTSNTADCSSVDKALGCCLRALAGFTGAGIGVLAVVEARGRPTTAQADFTPTNGTSSVIVSSIKASRCCCCCRSRSDPAEPRVLIWISITFRAVSSSASTVPPACEMRCPSAPGSPAAHQPAWPTPPSPPYPVGSRHAVINDVYRPSRRNKAPRPPCRTPRTRPECLACTWPLYDRRIAFSGTCGSGTSSHGHSLPHPGNRCQCCRHQESLLSPSSRH